MNDELDISGQLRAWARARPTQPALIEPVRFPQTSSSGWREITFQALDSLADGYAHGLVRAGVQTGHRVIFLLRPSSESLAALYALLRIGAIPVAVDTGMGLVKVLRCIEQIRPHVVMGVPAIHALRMFIRRPFASAEVFVTQGRRWFWGGHSLEQCRSENRAPFQGTCPTEEVVSAIAFTSGSTGTVKAVSITSGMIPPRFRLVSDCCGWKAGMRIVVCFPSQAPTALYNGLTVILPRMDYANPATARPELIAQAINDHEAEAVLASPVVWVNLVRYCHQQNVKLPSVREALTAGAPVPIRLHRRLKSVMHSRGRLHTPYGSTEALPVTSANSDTLIETWEETRRGHGTCVGKPLPGIRVSVIRITDEAIANWTDDLCVGQGEIGEIVVGGPVVSPEYIESPQANALAKIRRDGETLHRMGDLGYFDKHGRVWFCGRKAHRIETTEGLVLPVPVENVFNEHPKVFRTAVVGVGRPGEQQPVACVQMEPDEQLTPQVETELKELANGTRWRNVVQRFVQHPAFPVDPRHNSKIERGALSIWASRVVGREVS